jgi:hypothetical protein
LHRDERGTISFLTVFAVLILVMLLGMVMNVGRQVDGKIRMQNAADSAAYSGGLVIARGMNTLVFTNHLMSEVFALTAFLQEAEARNSEKFVPSILAAWNGTAPRFGLSQFPKFQELLVAIPAKTPQEQRMVQTYGDWVSAVVPNVLPVMEAILQGEAIPKFQRTVVALYPNLAQAAALEMAEREGGASHGRGTMVGVLWRTSGRMVGGDGEYLDPSLPVIDPSIDPSCQSRARYIRNELARHYLREWNNYLLQGFDRFAKMSQFANLWRSFTCAYLEDLLNRYPTANLPMLLRDEPDPTPDKPNSNAYLDQYFTFLGVVYWGRLPEMAPLAFRNPITDASGQPADAMAFAQVRVYIPRPRLVYWSDDLQGGAELAGGLPDETPPGAMPTASVGMPPASPGSNDTPPVAWRVRREPGASDEWNLFNQRWTVQLVPATTGNLSQVLQTVPPLPEFRSQGLRLPNLSGMDTSDIARINTH